MKEKNLSKIIIALYRKQTLSISLVASILPNIFEEEDTQKKRAHSAGLEQQLLLLAALC